MEMLYKFSMEVDKFFELINMKKIINLNCLWIKI